jgi:hypothetical protein
MHITKAFILETFKPLFVFLGAITIADINTIFGTIAGGCSAVYSVFKLVDYYKQKKKTKKR